VLMISGLRELRYPLLALDVAADLAVRMLAIHGSATAAPPPAVVLGHRTPPAVAQAEPCAWTAATAEAAMGLAGLRIRQRLPDGLYLCEPAAVPLDDPAQRAQLLAATGRPWKHLLARELVT
jgi:hypothetical protein